MPQPILIPSSTTFPSTTSTEDTPFVQELSVRIVSKLSIFPESGVKIGKLRYVFGGYVEIYDLRS